MNKTPMLWRAAPLFAALWLAAPAVLVARELPPAESQLQQVTRYGPYATMGRANQVANDFRQQGCAAVAFHSGDGYYVDVRC